MTHTLHRRGSLESLKEDYIVLSVGSDIPFGISRIRLRRKFPRIYEMVKRIFLDLGILKLFRVVKRLNQTGRCGSRVFNSKKELASYLRELKERNNGKSVLVSGLFDEVNGCLRELNLSPHTVQISLGIFGKKELLPREEILEITTMCGHHMVSPRLVEKLVSDVKSGKISSAEAALVMNRQCVCGIFNKERACKLLQALAK